MQALNFTLTQSFWCCFTVGDRDWLSIENLKVREIEACRMVSVGTGVFERTFFDRKGF